jgi:hypothetical protein
MSAKDALVKKAPPAIVKCLSNTFEKSAIRAKLRQMPVHLTSGTSAATST